MTRSSYWERSRTARISRRRLIGGAAAVGLGAAGLAVVACGDGNGDESGPPPGPTPTTSPTTLEPVGTRGGFTRYFQFDALVLDTRDPHQTQFGPTYNTHSAIFSKVLRYESDVQQIMSPDLADGMPEQPDDLTYVIKLRPNVFFHDTPDIQKNFPDVAGRRLTAEDVKFSIERQLNEDSPRSFLYYRRGQWQTIDTIELVDDLTLRITTKAPTAPFLHYLADRNAYIIATELVDENDEINEDSRLVGTGPFMLDKLESLTVVRVVRNPNWFARDDNPDGVGPDRPFLDGYESLWTPESDSVQEAALKSKQIDGTAFIDQKNTDRVNTELTGKVMLTETGVAGYHATRFLVDPQSSSPFRDFRARRAVHLAVDRHLLGQQISQQHFKVSGPVAWPMTLWALPQEELLKKPGYRPGTVEREEDIVEARRLWEAAGGNEAIGTLSIIFAGVPSDIVEVALPSVKRMLEENLGARVETEVDPTGYTVLAECFLRNTLREKEGTCPFTYAFDNGWIDLDDWMYPYFRTGGPKNSFVLSDSELDALLDRSRETFDLEERRKIGFDIQNYLLDKVNARLEYFNGLARVLTWSYVRNPGESLVRNTWFGHNENQANTWLDTAHPEWRGRPA